VKRIRDGAPDQWACVVFIAVAEYKSRKRAVEYLFEEHGEVITPEGVSAIVRKIEEWLKEPAFEEDKDRRKGNLVLTPRGKRFLRFAKRIAASYQEERRPTLERSLPKIVCFPHHVYITSRLECALRQEHGGYDDRILVEELAHSGWSDDTFEDRALFPLTLGHHEIAIGAATAEHKQDLQSDRLYTAHLEALVHVGFAHGTLSLTDLVTQYRAMLPPEDARSRKLLESWIAEHRIPDPGKKRRVAAETYDIMTSVQRVCDDHRVFGPMVRRVVVVPSDVALLYKAGSCFGGVALQASKWVPVQHKGERLSLPVFVTTTNPRPMHLRPIVERIKEICAADPGLGGVRAAPRQRRPPGEL
jgi:DNA-binding transcriptional LysR family regulator